jgi:steroid delta-isomerase-like uncharacterized protein
MNGRRDDLRSFFRDYISTWNKHRFEEISSYYAEWIVINGERRTRQSLLDELELLTSCFPDWRWGIDHLLVDGDRLAVHFVDTGTHRGLYEGIPSTGRSFSITELAHYRVVDGKIAELQFWCDFESLKQQIS